MKQSTLYRLSIALLTTVLMLCACVMVRQWNTIIEKDDTITSLRSQVNFGAANNQLYQSSYEASQRDLARQKQINAHMERWLNDAARNDKPQATARYTESTDDTYYVPVIACTHYSGVHDHK